VSYFKKFEFSALGDAMIISQRQPLSRGLMKKYKNKSINAYGIKWDSKSELARYEQLVQMEKKQEILNLKVHSKEINFLLLEKCTYKSFLGSELNQRKITYTPDFVYTTKNGILIAEDVKGMLTEAFRIKAKIFRYRYPDIVLRVVKAIYTKNGYRFEDI
jgi:hypothetical protein